MTAVHLAATDPAVADHLVGGQPVLPAAAQIDAVLSACAATRPGDRWWLDHVAFLAPLRVGPAGVETRTEIADDGTALFRSRAPGDGEWTTHGRASTTSGSLNLPRYLDTAALRARCTDAVPAAEIAAWRAASGIAYGPTYRAIRSAHRGDGVLLAMLRTHETGAHVVPPSLLDSVFQCLGLLDAGAAGACLPWFVGRIAVRRPISGTVLAQVEITPGEAASGVVRGRAVVCSLQGEVLLELDRIVLKAATRAPADPAAAGPASPGPVAVPLPRTAPTPAGPAPVAVAALPPVPPPPATAPPATAQPATAQAPTAPAAPEARDDREPRAEGRPTRVLDHPPTGDPSTDAAATIGTVLAPGWEVVTPTAAADTGTVLVVSDEIDGATGTDAVHDGRLAATVAQDRTGRIVYLPRPDDGTAATATHAVQTAFALVRALAAKPPMAGLTIVTRGAHGLGGGAVQPSHTALWGLVRSLRVENPRTAIRLVDLEPDAPASVVAQFEDPELVRRGGTWSAPVLAPPTATGRPFPVDGGRFLITGGMSGIGLHVAEMLADDGCAHLTLLGRTEPRDGERRLRIDRLARRCDLRILTCDVRDLADALRDVPRFDGVVHSAGVLRDGLARTLTSERIDEVLAPKIGGAHAIDAAFPPDRRPGAVVLFSSISAVHGNLGQSSYSAANAYLDGFAAARRAGGESWFSLGWGLWNVGMGEQIVQGAAARGIPALSADEGIALLRTGLALPPAHYVLSAAHRPKDEPMTTVAPEGRLWPSLASILQTTLHVRAVSPDDNLLELGLDSMMAVEVAAALSREGLEVDPGTFFEHARVDELVAHLDTLPRTGAPAPHAATPAPAPALPAVPAPASPQPVTAPVPHQPIPQQPIPHQPVAQQPVAHQPVTAPGDAFVPDWNQFRDLDGPRPAASGTAPAPPVAAATPAPPAPIHPRPVPTQQRLGGGEVPTRGVGAPRPPQGPPGPSGAPTPRRTLPGRLADRPDGTFLDRRIDALSAEDRTIVAQDDYFYEPVIEEAGGSWIKFDGRWFLNFASYSYLGLIGHDYIDTQAVRAVEKHGTGAHGVRLLAGTLHLHRELELALARFLGTEDAIVYSSGYMANVATVGALVGPGDVVIGDVYNHASILDGYRLSGAKVITYAHNDLDDLERALRKVGDAGRLVVTDAVFSMDGDIAPLPQIVELCERYDAPLMVDEAHSLGVLGATGRGITEHFGIDPARVAVKMGTLSKTVPSAGGYVAGSADLVFALKNNARGWMFSAAATPAQVAAAKAAIDVIAAAPSMVTELHRRTERYRGLLRGLGFDTLASETPVVPVICRSAEQAQEMARLCQADGLFVQPIVYPAVPKALPRLRTIVNLSHSDEDIDLAVAAIERAGRRIGLIA
ncbi:aminotransferase class I/II-fold pyridoxal phosphate-dependent enzyme [Pseudonocardia abyssalis]|uniref:Aminotransferase class I/II-fold pyridoxal phosphate-dependent enzyme n=1 Tax=Pseudonocardia abyssalis TaxID=2792008 RepID=A0ABS6UM57_9PSEU|nr:aminotransferase class I/II-fold pyridoxal phosphate-dependent enzyme [Pseudonocardia abyssalis]